MQKIVRKNVGGIKMITVEELKNTFETVFGQGIDISNLSEESDLRKDVGMNSISLLYMAMVLEEKYSIKFNNSDFEKISMVKDVIELVKSKVQEK